MGARVGKDDAVLYLYGISRTPVTPVGRVTGVGDVAALETVDCDGLVSWVIRVNRREFADELAKNMENLDWLAKTSAAHQRVVAAIAESNEILPARLATVFLTETSLCKDVQSRRATLENDFRRIRGGEEWGIKVFVLPPKLAARQPVRSGKEYLRAKSVQLEMRRPKRADGEIARLTKELGKLSLAMTEGGKISGGRRDLQFQASVLLKRTDRKKFEALVRRFSREWKGARQIEATGPWPPYSFVTRSSELSVG